MYSSSMGMLRVAVPSVDREALGVEDAAAADRQQAFGRAEGRLHQDLGHIAGLVGFLVGDQGDLFLLHLAGGRLLAAADPAGELALVQAPQLIGDRGGDAVGAAHRGLEGAGDRLSCASPPCRSARPTSSSCQLPPLYFHSSRAACTSTGRSATGLPSRSVTIKSIFKRRAALDKVALAAQAHIQAGRVHQQGGGAGPGLAVDIHHGGFGQDADRAAARRPASKSRLQVMLAGGIGLAGEGFDCASAVRDRQTFRA